MNTDCKHIAFLLGAGFSVPAGLPMAKKLNDAITSKIYNDIRESFKDSKDGMLKGFISEKVLLDCEKNGSFNYEQYYDLLNAERNKPLDRDNLLSFIECGMYRYYWHRSIMSDTERTEHCNHINNIFYSIVEGCYYADLIDSIVQQYQYFIANNLTRCTSNGKLQYCIPAYDGFINILKEYVNRGYVVDIYTLNHDLCLESLLAFSEIKDDVCNGFGGAVEFICQKPYKTFNLDCYNKPISIYKLHGSLDVYELSFINRPKKEYIQILDGYTDKNAFLIENEKICSIQPLFLTGKSSKEGKYNTEPYKTIIKEFERYVGLSEKLIVIGYSGNDEGINKIVYEKCKGKRVYVVSPDSDIHPYLSELNAYSMKKGIGELAFADIEKCR